MTDTHTPKALQEIGRLIDHAEETWTIVRRGTNPVLQSSYAYWNTCEIRPNSLLFYRDVALGTKERVEVTPTGRPDEFTLYIRQNIQPFYFDDWVLVEMRRARKIQDVQ